MSDELPDYWPRYYIPDPETHELRVVGMWEWAHWLETTDRSVAWTGNDHKWVSTVCLGLDHRHFGDGPPLVFESMVFVWHGDFHEDGLPKGHRKTESLDMDRYGSWAAAEAGHKRLVEKYLINAETRMKVDVDAEAISDLVEELAKRRKEPK